MPAIVSGRERWGTPKQFVDVFIEQHHNLLVSTTVKDGVMIMAINSQIGEPAEEKEMIPLFPSYRLRIIPKADGPGAAIKQIVAAAPEELVTHSIFKGSGTVNFSASANTDLSILRSLETLGAFYYVADYTETYGRIVYDYLERR